MISLITLFTFSMYFLNYLYLCSMCKEKLITGIKVSQQMSKARTILNTQVIPREELFQLRKKEGKLSPELLRALKTNA